VHRHVLEVARGGGFLAGGTLFEFVTRFFIALVLARFLGADDYGLYVLALSAATLCSAIALLGLDDALVRYVAILAGRRDRQGLWGALQIGLGVSALAGIVTGGGLYLAAGPMAGRLFDAPQLAPLLRLLAVVVPFLTMSNVLAGTARGFRRMDYAAFAENVVQNLVRLGLLGILVLLRDLDVLAATIAFGVADVASTLTLIALLRRRLVGAFGRHPQVRRDVRQLFGFALPLWLSGLLRKFRNNVEVVVLGALGTASSVGVYAVAYKVNLVGHVALLSILVAVKPVAARLHDQGDRRGLTDLYVASTRWTLGLNIPFFVVVLLYAEPLMGIFGASFASGATALVIITVGELVNAGTGVCGAVLDMTGHSRMKLANSVLWTVLLLGTGAVLIPRRGVVGAAIASALAVSVVNVLTVVEVWVLERMLPFDRTFLKPLAAGAGALAAGLVLRGAFPVGTGQVIALAQCAAIACCYAGLILLMGLAPEDRAVVDRIVHKVKTALPPSGRRLAVGLLRRGAR
jgi:O-antigen/teichoic acid export membrane protein